MSSKNILYIEDEVFLSRIVKEALGLKGYNVVHLKDGTGIMDALYSFRPDVCILDVMLPEVDGFTLGSTIRNILPDMPVIYVTAKTHIDDLKAGFSSGGTDYIRKPFSMEELILRIENQLRLSAGRRQDEPGEQQLSIGSLLFYPARYELHTSVGVIKLSNREAQVLSYLYNHRNLHIERKQMLQMIWGDDTFFNSRNLDVYIRKLRAHFNEDPGVGIITLKGRGFFFRVDDAGAPARQV